MSALPTPRAAADDLVAAPLVEATLPAVVAIENDIYEFPWTLGNFRDSLRAGYSCWEYADRLGLAGYAVLSIGAGEAHLLNLSIARRAQGQGYGSRAVRHLLDCACEHGAGRLILEVRPSNAAARSLYTRFGFERIGIRKSYYPAAHGREDALVLGRDLP